MKTPILGAFLFLLPSAYAVSVSKGKSYCETDPKRCSWTKPEVKSTEEIRLTKSEAENPKPAKINSTPEKRNIRKSAAVMSEAGNLPNYYFASNAQQMGSIDSVGAEDERIIEVEKVMGALLPGIRSGDILEATVEQSIKASPNVPTPLRARILSGRYRGAYFLGVAVLDRELKRILITFERMRIAQNEMAYALKATGLALSGQVGIEGQYHTQEGKFLAGEILSATAAGFADYTVQRNQTSFGTYQTEPSLSNSTKQGVVQALSKTAERFAEQSRNAPEYTEIEAGRLIQIILQESPTEVNGS